MNSLFNNYTGYDYCTESSKACWCIISSVSLDSLYAVSFFLLQCLQDHWQSLLLEHNFLSECTCNVTEIKCKTGNKFFSFPLASWLYLFLPPLFLFHSIPFSSSFPSYKLIYQPLLNEASAVVCHDDDWDIIYSWIQLYTVNSLGIFLLLLLLLLLLLNHITLKLGICAVLNAYSYQCTVPQNTQALGGSDIASCMYFLSAITQVQTPKCTSCAFPPLFTFSFLPAAISPPHHFTGVLLESCVVLFVDSQICVEFEAQSHLLKLKRLPTYLSLLEAFKRFAYACAALILFVNSGK